MSKSFFKVISFILVAAVLLGTLCSCSFFKKFELYSCASGFYFNRSENKSYQIKELGIKSDSNYFYLEDYFCSEELGSEYKIKGTLFNVGSVYLAKKSEHYNPDVYTFDVFEHNNGVIKITPEMNYVKITSAKPTETANTYIHIEDRELPLDITFSNVKMSTKWGIPVLFSAAFTDINIILEGENSLESITPSNTVASFIERMKGVLSGQEKLYYDTLKELEYAEDTFKGKNEAGDVAHHYFTAVTDVLTMLPEGLLNGVENLLSGKEGSRGMNGASAIVHPCGISISGDGSLYVKGGSGAKGGNASVSLFGTADGGDGGNGGSGISCANLLDISASLTAEGGVGGFGGEASKGLIGSGNQGLKGKDGLHVQVANPKDEK